jgi:hypothetical protein
MMSGHWDVEQCNNKQLEFQLAGHESNVKSGRLVSTTTGWDGGGDDGMYFPNDSAALSAPQLRCFNRLIVSSSKYRRLAGRITALSIARGECLSFRIQDHGIGIAFVGLASLLGRVCRGSTSGPSKVPSKVLRYLSHSDIDRKR